ncbi:MAG: DUF4340 domain-containing protein [Clostridia bacterium]|nr:DUF4340 domain-containing protein [Clostridia bacterium]
MNKQKKNILIAAVVLVILFLTVLIAWLVLPSIEPDSSESVVDTVSVYNFDSAFIERLDFINPDSGDDYAICKGIKAGTVYYYIENDDTFESRQSYFIMTLEMIAGLDAGKLVEENPADLSKYGIDDEKATVKIHRTDVDMVDKIVFGDYYPLDGTYVYAYVSSKDAVYTIGSSIRTTLSSSPTYYRETNIVPQLSEATFEELQRYTCTLPDGYVLSFERSTEEGLLSVFVQTKPKQGAVDDYNVANKILNKLIGISAIAVVEDNPKNLEAYGLDDPIRVDIDYVDGGRYSLLIGSRTDEVIFVMLEGVPMVIAATGDYTFLDVRGEDILSTGIFLHNIKDVTKAVFATVDKEYVLIVDDQTDDEGNGVFNASFQGKPMEQAEARSLYSGMLSFFAVNSYTGKLPQETQYTLTFTMRDGTVNKLELRKLNSRQYAAVVNGTCNSYVSITAVNHLLNLIDMVEKGESIEDIF